MKSKQICIDCRTLIGAPISNEPHIALKTYVVKVLAEGRTEYYECRACSAKLLREQRKHDPSERWQLVF
jgi:DNA-directed RNA polymerase subunit RPC12/RpoP